MNECYKNYGIKPFGDIESFVKRGNKVKIIPPQKIECKVFKATFCNIENEQRMKMSVYMQAITPFN